MNGSLRDAFEDLAAEARPVDLAARVTRGARRRRQRRVGAVAVATLALVLGTTVVLGRVDQVRPASPGKAYDVFWADDQSLPRYMHYAATVGSTARAEQGTGPVDAAALSPDGRKVALVVGQTVDVLVLDGARRTVEGFALPAADNFPEIAWAPDNRRVAVTDPSDPGITSAGFWVLDTVTGESRYIRHGHLGAGLGWAPDGQTLAVSAVDDRGDPAGIDLVPLDGGPVRRLGAAERWLLASAYSWSPDGTRLVVLDNGGTSAESFVVDVATGSQIGGALPGGRYVWRGPDRLAVERIDGLVETGLDGREIRVLYPFGRTGGHYRVAVRPGS
ncbi:MAG TPA: hypothetical protein VNA20_12260 [Frankiaceae bacterium]|nr:hypothetical protein [Frankiaceae bacterium]